MPNVMSCLRMASRYFFCPTVLAVTPGFFFVRLHAVVDQIFQSFRAVVFHDIQCVRELAVFHRRTGFQHIFQRRKKLFRALNAVRRAFEFDPAFARRGLDAEFGFQRLQIARLVIEQAVARTARSRNEEFQLPQIKIISPIPPAVSPRFPSTPPARPSCWRAPA